MLMNASAIFCIFSSEVEPILGGEAGERSEPIFLWNSVLIWHPKLEYNA